VAVAVAVEALAATSRDMLELAETGRSIKRTRLEEIITGYED